MDLDQKSVHFYIWYYKVTVKLKGDHHNMPCDGDFTDILIPGRYALTENTGLIMVTTP